MVFYEWIHYSLHMHVWDFFSLILAVGIAGICLVHARKQSERRREAEECMVTEGDNGK